MVSRRFIALLLIAAAGLAAIVALAAGAGGGAAAPRVAEPAVAPVATPTGASVAPGAPTAGPASATAAESAATTRQTAPAAPPLTNDDVLGAVRTLKRFCDLVDDGRLGVATRLLSGPWVWPRRELKSFTGLRFVSARVQPEAVADNVVFLTRVRARLRAPSPLHDGVDTLFFTLGRDGTTGGWLITAVTTSP